MKRKLIYFLTVAVIAFFILELFTVVMWTPSSGEENATPTPSAEQEWQGQALATARVYGVTPNFLAECNASATTITLLTKELASLEGVEGQSVTIASLPYVSFRANETAFGEDASGNKTQAFYNALNATFARADCAGGAKILREALLDFEGDVYFEGGTQSGAPMNATLYQRDLELYAYRAGQAKPTGFLIIPVYDNETAVVALYAYFVQGQVAQLFIQETGAAAGAAEGAGSNADNATS